MVTTARDVGTLIVVILKAKNLPNKRHIGKQDPFCTVTFNGEKRRTKAIRRGGQHPEWDEEVRYTLLEDTELEDSGANSSGTPPPVPPKKKERGPPKVQGGTSLSLACYADDPREPELIGETNVDLSEVLTKGETDEWFTLMHKDKYCGEVYLELTFWSNEPPPVKKAPAKQRMYRQYGGPGSFVPGGEIDVQATIARLPSSSSYMRDTIPPSLRSASSIANLGLYVPPYESMRSTHSSMDSVINEFAQFGVSDDNLRENFTPQQRTHPRRPSSFIDYTDSQGLSPHPAHSWRQSTYSDGGYVTDQPVTPTATGASAYQASTFSTTHDSYQVPYESVPNSQYQPSYQTPAHHTGPRYSAPSSGFVPVPTPAPSGFVPLPRHTSQPTMYNPSVSSTPTPVAYGGSTPPHSSLPQLPQVPASHVLTPASSFSALPATSLTSSGFTTASVGHPALYHHNSLPQPTVSYGEVPQSQPPPSSSWTWAPSHSQTTSAAISGASWQSNGLQPSNLTATQPPQQSSYGPPTSSFTPAHSFAHPHPPHTERQQSAPLPGQVPTGPQIPPPPTLNESQSSNQMTRTSRPLPQPRVRRASLPVPPPAALQYSNVAPNSAFPSSMSYNAIPPPPPLPQHPQHTGTPVSYQDGSRLPPSVPPPPALHPAQPPASAPAPPPRRRPSLPPPPPLAYAQQQSGFQTLPPPPPPPALPSHIQHEIPTSSFIPSSSQAFHLGPPPRPPAQLQTQLRCLPPPLNGTAHHSDYSSP